MYETVSQSDQSKASEPLLMMLLDVHERNLGQAFRNYQFFSSFLGFFHFLTKIGNFPVIVAA